MIIFFVNRVYTVIIFFLYPGKSNGYHIKSVQFNTKCRQYSSFLLTPPACRPSLITLFYAIAKFLIFKYSPIQPALRKLR